MLNYINVFSLSFFFGVCQLLWLPMLKVEWLLGIVAILFLTLLLTKKITIILVTGVIGLSCGLAYGLIMGMQAKISQLSEVPNNTVMVSGRVTGLPITHDDHVRFSLIVEESVEFPSLKKLLINWYQTQENIEVGQHWYLELKLKPVHGQQNEATFDYAKWLFRHGFDATATVKQAQLISGSDISVTERIDLWRANIAKLIEVKINNPRVQSIIKALIIGDKSDISHNDANMFRMTGTAHLIAISGLHIGLMAFVGVMIGRFIFWINARQSFNRFKCEAFFAISFAVIYALLAGFSTSTQRALVMVVVFALAYAYKWFTSRWHSWCIALLVVISIDPFSVMDGGMWLSFSAVAVLIFAFNGRESRWLAFVKAQWVILVGLTPLVIISFHQVNLLSPLINMLVLPLASLFLIPLIFLSLAAHVIYVPFAELLFDGVTLLTELLLKLLTIVQDHQLLTFNVVSVSYGEWFIMLLASIVLLLPRLFYWRFLAIIFYAPLFGNQIIVEHSSEFVVDVLDIGQGLSVIVHTKNHHMIYDTGARFDSGFSAAKSVIVPFLNSQGVNQVEKLLLSHQDNDHAGGTQVLYHRYPNVQIYGVTDEYQACQYPLSWQWDGIYFEVLSPFELVPYLGNNSSCVLKISSPHGSMLLTGDIEEPIEYRLTHHLSHQIHSDVLLVPHHGSRTSSSDSFIDVVKPRIAINSAGFLNQFNHPHPQVKQRYLQRGIKFYDTQFDGAIRLDFRQGGVKVNTFVEQNKHFWRVDL